MTRRETFRQAVSYRSRMRALGYGPLDALACAIRFYRYMRAG